MSGIRRIALLICQAQIKRRRADSCTRISSSCRERKVVHLDWHRCWIYDSVAGTAVSVEDGSGRERGIRLTSFRFPALGLLVVRVHQSSLATEAVGPHQEIANFEGVFVKHGVITTVAKATLGIVQGENRTAED
jgi:hypothetical protein